MTATLPITRRAAKITVEDRDQRHVRNKDYQKLPLGSEIRDWLATLAWEDLADNTRESYEIVGARLCQEFPDLTRLEDFCENGVGEGTALLEWFLQKHWADAAGSTRNARRAALRSLFRWAHERGKTSCDPAEKIRSTKRRPYKRHAHAPAVVLDLVFAQDTVRDRICIQLLARLGLRKNELRLLQGRDIRLDVGVIFIRHGKGDKPREIPIRSLKSLRDELEFHVIATGLQPREYLLHPQGHRDRPMDQSSVHRWFKRCLERAGLPATIPMHELRHTAGDNLHRATGDIVAVQQLLGHESVGTTQAYLHPTTDDLDRKLAVEEAGWREALSERGLRYATA